MARRDPPSVLWRSKRRTPLWLLLAVLSASLLAACTGDSGSNQVVVAPLSSGAGSVAGSPQTPPAASDPSPAPNVPEPAAAGAVVTQGLTFNTSDGEQLHAILRSRGDFSPRPLLIEFSPYGVNSDIPDFGPAYNHVFVHARGTGQSSGVWGAVGPRDQQDVAEFLAWACHQPWSNGHIGLYGFSASAIAIYNSLQLPLACVDAASLMAGTNELYRDLLYPGGIPGLVPLLVVGAGVGLPARVSDLPALQEGQSPVSRTQSGIGLFTIAADYVQHPSEDDYWISRTQRAGPNHFPVLANTSFYDVESRGPFESYQMLRALGVPVQLRALGAHDGIPVGTAGPFPEYQRWFDRYLLGSDNGIDREPVVQLLVGEGSYEAMAQGKLSRISADNWPIPGTRWQRLYLDSTRGGGADSINDGTLATTAVTAQATQVYPALLSLPTATDPNTTAAATNGGIALFAAFPFLANQLPLVEPLALTYTTPVFKQDVMVAGPASLDVFVTTLTPEADLYAVAADVWPDGSSHPVGIGRLRTSYPNIIRSRSLIDANQEVVQPYADHSVKTYATPGQMREYHVEFWPIGNRFQSGHRLRLYLVGAAAYGLPAPGLNLVSIGGITPSRLLLPVLPGSDVCAATGSAC